MLDVAFGVFIVAFLAFWALFFTIVLPRLHEKGIEVEKGSRFGFLVAHWPREELVAYHGDLHAEEKAKWYNRYLAAADTILIVLLVACAASLLISIVPAR